MYFGGGRVGPAAVSRRLVPRAHGHAAILIPPLPGRCEEIVALIKENPGARGIRQARRVIAFAQPAAQLPGESISRLYLSQLGFAAPRLHVRVPGPAGRDYEMDFAFDALRTFGEFDGVRKYSDPLYLRGRTPEQALLDEKRREDWVRGTTQWRIVRWEMSHLSSARTLESRLARFGIAPPGRGN